MRSNLNKISNMGQRIISGLLGALIIIFSVYWNEWSYFFIFLFILIFTQYEFYKLTRIEGMLPLKYYGIFTGGAVYVIFFLVEKKMLNPEWYLLVFPLLSVIFLIKVYWKTDTKPFTGIAYTFCGLFYVALPFSLLHVIAFSTGGYSSQIILGILFLLWASDTGAYFSGTWLGKTPLFSRISPKKTWEGSIGGGILALIVALIMAHYFSEIAIWQWITMALIIVVFGTYGDLVASLLKRSMAIKDSGNTIPGHGGFLDRFDGLILSTHFIALFLKIF